MVFAFLRRQALEFHRGGFKVLPRKCLRLLIMGWVLPVVLLMRVLRPLIVIRLGGLRGERIGHFIGDTEVYLCERDAGCLGQRSLDVFYHTGPPCNLQLKKMWDRTLLICPLARHIDNVSMRLPGGQAHRIPIRADQQRDYRGLLARTPPHLSFTPEEERRGQTELLAMGLPQGVPFVCFHQRDNAYLATALPEFNWGYHDYRDHTLASLIPAALELAQRGYYVLRTGSVVKEALPDLHPRIIDYATRHRTDFLDIYIGAKCRFYFGSDAGIYAISSMFRRPVLFVHFPCLALVHSWNPQDMLIPKKVWDRREKRFLTIREVLTQGIGRFDQTKQYEERGVVLMENTAEEVKMAVLEMEERLKGTWQPASDDEDLQKQFWDLYHGSSLHGIIRSRVGAYFLRTNRGLLD